MGKVSVLVAHAMFTRSTVLTPNVSFVSFHRYAHIPIANLDSVDVACFVSDVFFARSLHYNKVSLLLLPVSVVTVRRCAHLCPPPHTHTVRAVDVC